MPEFSIVTIVKERRKQLANLLESIRASTILPRDIQVVFMDEPENLLFPEGLKVRVHRTNNSDELPLAAARNRGIAAVETEKVIFIDVDCIVSPTLFAGMLGILQTDNLIAAYPLYLSLLPDNGDYIDLLPRAVIHPDRERIPAGQPVHHLQFWSLIFAIEKPTFRKIGGFDESFVGYGAEDTDFAMMFNQAGIEQIFVRDHVLHQYHDKYDPPLNHFNAIINNARRYQQKWNVLPMQRWLKAFEKLGLIELDPANTITIIAEPSNSLIAGSRSSNPY